MHYLAFILLFFAHLAVADTDEKFTTTIPALLLANSFHQKIALPDYWVSEKYDGVRAYWNGKQLVSRHGHTFSAPEWYIRNFPHEPLDGELWIERGSFEKVSGIVRTGNHDNPDWQKVHYMVFDAPAHPQDFNGRIKHLHHLLDKPASPYIQMVKQWKVTSFQQLQQQLDTVVKQGGEGLMLHKGNSFYKGERSDDLLKLKPFDDAEAVVVRHIPGKGKFSQLMGSMEVVNPDGKHFRIGTGFTNAERKNPPPVGTTVTYRFNGFTRNGLPRFPRFLRRRNE